VYYLNTVVCKILPYTDIIVKYFQRTQFYTVIREELEYRDYNGGPGIAVLGNNFMLSEFVSQSSGFEISPYGKMGNFFLSA